MKTKYLLVSYCYTDSFGNKVFEMQTMSVEINFSPEPINISLERSRKLVQDVVQKLLPLGAVILNIVDLSKIVE